MIVEGFSKCELADLLQPSIILIHALQLLIEFQKLADDDLQGYRVIELLSDDVSHQIPRIRHLWLYGCIDKMHSH